MQIKLRFLGAAQNVTGSRHMLEVNGTRLLVDCGLYQERQFKSRNWEPFDFPASSIDAVLLTHAHLDHCGLLPKLVKEGFAGPVYCTSATAEIARIIMLDSARLQEEDAEFKRKRHEREGRKGPHPVVPLYTTADVEATVPLFRKVRYKKPVQIADGIEATFCEAGHVLGSAVIHVCIEKNGEIRSVLFSGDVGRPDRLCAIRQRWVRPTISWSNPPTAIAFIANAGILRPRSPRSSTPQRPPGAISSCPVSRWNDRKPCSITSTNCWPRTRSRA